MWDNERAKRTRSTIRRDDKTRFLGSGQSAKCLQRTSKETQRRFNCVGGGVICRRQFSCHKLSIVLERPFSCSIDADIDPCHKEEALRRSSCRSSSNGGDDRSHASWLIWLGVDALTEPYLWWGFCLLLVLGKARSVGEILFVTWTFYLNEH